MKVGIKTESFAGSYEKIINHEGAQSFALPEKERLVTSVLTTFWNEQKFYGDNSDQILKDIRNTIKKDPVFVAKLAIYAREQMYLRTIPVVMLGELAIHAPRQEKSFIRYAIRKVLTRPDQCIELVEYINQQGENLGKKIKVVIKGLQDVLPNFDEYQLAKYKGKGKIKLKDIFRIAHPRPADKKQSKLWKSLVDGDIATPITWETQISKYGNKPEVWDKLIIEKKLPYMASLRNLRNIIQSRAKHIPDVLDYINNQKAISNSKQLPFRFYSAYKQLENVDGASIALKSLSDALKISIENLPRLSGRTFASADNSHSMEGMLSLKGMICYKDIANIFQSILATRCDDVTTSVFGTDFKVVNIDKNGNVLDNVEKLKKTDVGWSTNGHLVIQHLLQNKKKVDRVILFTDCQLWDSNDWGDSLADCAECYWKEINPNCWFHIIDLNGYGTTPVIGNRVNIIAGWSDNIFKYIKMVEDGCDNLIKDIERVQLF